MSREVRRDVPGPISDASRVVDSIGARIRIQAPRNYFSFQCSFTLAAHKVVLRKKTSFEHSNGAKIPKIKYSLAKNIMNIFPSNCQVYWDTSQGVYFLKYLRQNSRKFSWKFMFNEKNFDVSCRLIRRLCLAGQCVCVLDEQGSSVSLWVRRHRSSFQTRFEILSMMQGEKEIQHIKRILFQVRKVIRRHCPVLPHQ